MLIAQLQARDFRLFGNLLLNAHPRFNLIIGDNGAGKTSLLEALHVLGRGVIAGGCCRRSWRATAPRLGGKVTGQVVDPSGVPPELLKLTWREREIAIEYGQAEMALSELVRRLPLQILDPGMHRMLEEGPGIRRRFLDWGVFHVEHRFMPTWKRARRALRQRNAMLREGGSAAQLAPWNRELAESAEQLSALRRAHALEVEARSQVLLAELLPGERWQQLRCSQGWDAERGLPGRCWKPGLERDLGAMD